MTQAKAPMYPLGFWGTAFWFTGFSTAVSMCVCSFSALFLFGNNTSRWPAGFIGVAFITMIFMLFISVFAATKTAWSLGKESVSQGKIFYCAGQLEPGRYQVVGTGKVIYEGDRGSEVVFVRPNDADKFSAPFAFFSKESPSGTVLLVKQSEGVGGVNLTSIEVEYLNPA